MRLRSKETLNSSSGVRNEKIRDGMFEQADKQDDTLKFKDGPEMGMENCGLVKKRWFKRFNLPKRCRLPFPTGVTSSTWRGN